jgi:rhodanese-related sulfurtransferase
VTILACARRTAVLIVLVGALVSSTLIVCVSAYTSVDVGTAYGMITDGDHPNLFVLDVRTKGEYDSGHIYGATLIPVAELPARIGELASRKYDPILVYCGSGGRSQTASGILDSNGFTEVYNMLGGIAAWNSAGYPTWISTVHNLNTTYNYDTIQAAIDSALAMDGNVILVDTGIYREHVVVGKTLSIVGADPRNTVIDGNGTGTAVSVNADNVKVESFTIRNSSESGVRLIGGNYAQIQNNKITSNYCGVNVSSSFNMIFSNEIASNQYCGVLITGGNSTIFENNITSNEYGIYVNNSQVSNGNLIYHNNLNNTYQAVTDEATGLWDNGYPSGGNYWSDYNGTDLFSGEFQNVRGSDGIGDTAYIIDSNNTDRYPLIRRWLWGLRNLMITSTEGGTTSPAPGSFAYNTTAYVEVTAIAYASYIFDHWELDGYNGSETILTGVRTDTNHTLKAVFTQIKYALEITSTAGGNTDPSAGVHFFGSGTKASVNAVSDPWYYLDGWELDGVYVGIFNPEIVSMDKNHKLQAVFEPLDIGHDVATKWVASKSVVGQGFNLSINVTVIDIGSYTETFNVTAYADATGTGSENVTLPAGISTIVTLVWNTTGCAYGDYTLSGYAWPVPEEVDVADNNYTCGVPIHVGVPGDISGPTQGVYDGTTNMRDINYLILLFNTNPSSPNWNPNADVNNDGTVNMRDIQIAILNFNRFE